MEHTQSPHLTEEGIKAFEKMAQDGGQHATKSLSKLINVDVQVRTISVRTILVKKLSEIVGSPDDVSISLTMNITGEVYGDIILVYPYASALQVADLLARRPIHSTTDLSELDESALKESGNIIAGAFLSAISNYLSINMIEGVPAFSKKKVKDTIENATKVFVEHTINEEAVAFEVDFELAPKAGRNSDEEINAFFILLLSIDSAQKVTASLKNVSGGKRMTT